MDRPIEPESHNTGVIVAGKVSLESSDVGDPVVLERALRAKTVLKHLSQVKEEVVSW